MSFFDALKTDSWKDNEVKVNVIDPRTGDKMWDGERYAYVKLKSTESQEWIDQVEDNTRHAQNKSQEDTSVKEGRMNVCRAMAAITTEAYLPETVDFKKHDLHDHQKADQIRSKLRKWYYDVYAEFTKEAVEKISNNVLFMGKPEIDSSSEKPTGDGATAEIKSLNTGNQSSALNG